MWDAEYRAAQLSTRKRRRDDASSTFKSLEMNAYGTGNRPVRAVVSKSTMQSLLGDFNACEHGNEAATMLGGPEFDFGKSRDKTTAKSRRRQTVTVAQLERFLATFNISQGNLDSFERQLLNTLFQYAPEGVLLGDDRTGNIQARNYSASDYRLVACLIFIDPVGSAEQNVHEDVAGCDRDAVWNLIIPLHLDECATMAATIFSHSGGSEMGIGEGTMWDACWPHKGLGNKTSTERVFLHFVFAPFWMVLPDPYARDWHGTPVSVRDEVLLPLSKTDDPWEFIEEIQNGAKGVNGISQEYNNRYPLHDALSPLKSWVDRLKMSY
jgi:hypothetical protein